MNREKQTFNNFIVSQANEFAYLVAKKVARESNENFNPLYIYGKIGLGKTFLLKAIENEIKSQRSDLKVVYITTENFLNEYHIQGYVSSSIHYTCHTFQDVCRVNSPYFSEVADIP